MSRVLLCILLLSACDRMAPERVVVPVDSAAGEVPFELAGPGGVALVVAVHVNGGGPYQFILDTGATVSCIDEQLASALQLPDVQGVLGTAAGVGGEGRLRLVSIDSLSLGGVRAHELQACVVDLQHLGGMGLDVDGLIGLNVLREFRVTLDFERNVVTLQEP